jgi:hypothetical protein
MPSRTFVAREEESMPGFKASKSRAILLLWANAAGDCKLKPRFIYYSENPAVCVKSALPVVYKRSNKV